MFIEKIKIKTYTPYVEDLSQGCIKSIFREFTFYYTPFTKNEKLLEKACSVCKTGDGKEDGKSRFLIKYKNENCNINPCVYFRKFVKYLGNPEELQLEYVIGLPGGLGIEKTKGINYFLHTKETNHLPHIHARYQGDEILIYINTLEIKGKFKNKNKDKEALEYVKNNREKLLIKYRDYTNGIIV